MRISIAILIWLFAAAAALAADFNYEHFARIPIQHEGRIKPMQTFALIELQRLHGNSTIDDMPAMEWLAEAMFAPPKAIERPLFLIKDGDAQAMLNLPVHDTNLYTFSDITQAVAANRTLIESLLQKPAQELTPGQRAVLDVYDHNGIFTQLMLSCSLFLKLAIDAPELKATTFLDYYKYYPDLERSLAALTKRKGTNFKNYTAAETKLVQTVATLSMTLENSRFNRLLRVIPPQWSNDNEWLSPWAIFHAGQGSPASAENMRLWQLLARSYQTQDANGWGQASAALSIQAETFPAVRPSALNVEIHYYRLNPLGKSLELYSAGLLLALLGFKWVRARKPALLLTIIAAALHTLSIAARVYILERPPVGTLYESLIFVSLIAVLFGLYLERRQRNHLGLVVATLCGSLLLFVSQSFAEGDTMSMLIAVLNTNFWLATHVLCITAGYGFGIVAGIIAHVSLITRLQDDEDKARAILRGGYGTALIALLFTALGTILGGIWADQSWGRFWGWDPKENGALLICLWLIWMLHGRISGRLHELGFAVVMALLTVIIAVSWIGVNLLATGLHSYGFTDKAAIAFVSFCAAEIGFAAFCYATLWRKNHAKL